jgi:ribonuclease D
MIATVEDLEAIASDDRADVPALRGWRRTIFGEKALELKRGRLALAVENGKVVTFDWHDAESEPAPAAVPPDGQGAPAEEASASG